ncbi:MAG: hypothetical protein JO325_03325 [Solirubrobacterales bacterium]|nr:hypothetical protein [Solirubrobacterales bacterium]
MRELAMKRLTVQIGSLGATGLLISAVALAATPINNGFYLDRTHHVSVIVVQKKVATPSVVCHGTRYYPVRGVTVKLGRFSYTGTAAVAHGHHPPAATKKTLAIAGDFVTSRRVTGTAAVAGCTVSYSAKYAGSRP